MRITHWLIGCTLCVVAVGSAAAASRATDDLSSPHPALDAGDNSSSASGGVPGVARDCPSAHDGGNATSNSNGSSDRANGGSSAPSSNRRSHLGWQSLLPGSIQ